MTFRIKNSKHGRQTYMAGEKNIALKYEEVIFTLHYMYLFIYLNSISYTIVQMADLISLEIISQPPGSGLIEVKRRGITS